MRYRVGRDRSGVAVSLSEMQVIGGARHLTAEELGRVFASMNTEEQAQFFNGVAKGVAEWPNNRGYSDGEMQWCYWRDEMLKPENSAGLAVIQSMCAFILLHAWDATNTTFPISRS